VAECQQCMSSCSTCSDALTCDTCDGDQHRVLDSDQCNCMQGYAAEDDACVAVIVDGPLVC
jgi:hypothetical protein